MILLSCLLLILLLTVAYTLYTGISPMPTYGKAKRIVVQLARKHAEGPIIDCGSGFGTLVKALAKKTPHPVIGYELSPIPYLISRLFTWHQPNVTLHRQNFLTAPLDDASVIVCYLYPGGMATLLPKLPSNTWVISHAFALPNTTPQDVITVDDAWGTKIYLYRF
ncbi:MAG: class I SAM-dependent methyltransferase [Chlamydiia bacterium]|nr:class I SAM-dependent methyltransferase [Chlamydiia bacterium]